MVERVEKTDGSVTPLIHQVIPPGDWKLWEMTTDRGGGKSFGGALATVEMAKTVKSIALIGPSLTHVIRIMVCGPSGIIQTDPTSSFDPVGQCVNWESGAVARLYSDQHLDAIRGSELGWVWWDEPTLNYFVPRMVWRQQIELHIRNEPGKTLMTTSPPAGVVQTFARTEDNTHLSPRLLEEQS